MLLVRVESVEGNVNETIVCGQNKSMDFYTYVIITINAWS